MARRPGRRSAGIASRRAGSSRANRSGSGAASPPAGPGIRPRHRACRTLGRAAEQREEARPAADRIAPGIDRPQLRPDVEMDAARQEPGLGAGQGHGLAQLVRGHPELRRRRADRELAIVSGATSGFSRNSSSSGRRRPAARRHGAIGMSDPARRATRSASQRSGCPDAAAPDRRPQLGIGLADALERDPLVRHARPASDRPLAARDDVGVEAERPPPRATIAATSLALTEKLGATDPGTRPRPLRRRPGASPGRWPGAACRSGAPPRGAPERGDRSPGPFVDRAGARP